MFAATLRRTERSTLGVLNSFFPETNKSEPCAIREKRDADAAQVQAAQGEEIYFARREKWPAFFRENSTG